MTEEEMERKIREFVEQTEKKPIIRFKKQFRFEPDSAFLKELAEAPCESGDSYIFRYYKEIDNALYLFEEEYVYVGEGHFYKVYTEETKISE